MPEKLRYCGGVTLAGGGTIAPEVLQTAQAIAPALIAADGAADRLHALGRSPVAIIGDMDSLANVSQWRNRESIRYLESPDQMTTDFEKCLQAIDADFILAIGFTGGRNDHFLAALSAAIAASDQTILFLDQSDVMMALPAGQMTSIQAPIGSRMSILPLAPSYCQHCAGLRWSIADQTLMAGQAISISNQVVSSPVQLMFDQRGTILSMPAEQLHALLTS